MTSLAAMLAIFVAARPVPLPPPPPPTEPPVTETPQPEPAKPAATDAPKEKETAAPEPAKPKDEKLALVLGDLRVAPRAQVRVRGEVVGDKTLAGAFPAWTFTHRVRAGLDVEWQDAARAVFELQDVRAWGAERTAAGQPPDVTIFGAVANSIDLHQGFAGVFIGPVELRVGRQEIAFSNERVLGAVDWAQAGRAFDAIAVGSRGPGDFGFLAFCSLVRNRDHLPGAATNELTLCGGGVEHKVAPFFRYAPEALLELTSAAAFQRATVGVRVDGTVAGFSYDADAHGQASSVGGAVKAAFLVGARGAYEVDVLLHPKVGAMVDVVSGGDPAASTLVTFDTGFGTNHKFYGFQDLITNLPLHTQNRGLVDVAANVGVKEGPFSMQLAVHALAPTAYVGAGTAFYGIEPDLVGRYDVAKFLAVHVGGSLFVPIGDAFGRGNQIAPWGFAVVDVKL